MSVLVYYRHFSLVYTCKENCKHFSLVYTRRENCKQNNLIKLGNTSFGKVAMVMYLGLRVKNQNSFC